MDILILGAGAMGSLHGALLARAGYEVTLYDIDEEKVKSINEKGIRVTGLMKFTSHPKATTTPPSLPPNIIFVFTKSYSTEEALYSVRELVTRKTMLVSLQNGLGNEEVARNYTDKLVGGVTTYAAILEKPGVVRWTGKGITVIGRYPTGAPNYVYTLEKILGNAGFNLNVTANIIGWKWLKAIVNSAINPIGALLGVTNGFILATGILRNLAVDIVEEGSQIAVKHGVKLPAKPVEMLIKTLESTKDNYNSMLQDLSKCRRTEIDYINGKIVEAASNLGIKAPLNKALWSLVKGAELKCNLIKGR
ncbi:MAG: 2-dehydropantoate 2-reductase [Desulfurococcales archaeon]|nr:2-dehydropantoate 2-reductase [Desulfurococcales archaeon]